VNNTKCLKEKTLERLMLQSNNCHLYTVVYYISRVWYRKLVVKCAILINQMTTFSSIKPRIWSHLEIKQLFIKTLIYTAYIHKITLC